MPQPADLGAVLRRYWRQMQEAQYGAPGPFNQSRPIADPQNQTAASLLSFNNTARVLVGCITGVTAVANAYRIQYEKAQAPGIAIFAPRTTCAASGPRDLGTLQAGTMVLCVFHEQVPYSYIIAVLPPLNTQASTANASVLFNASRARVDELHRKPLRMPQASGIPDMLAGRPFDATMAGEAGWITETGLRIFLDSWMATLGVDESCHVTAFYHDQLLRIAAYNFQHWTACLERESMNDQGECLDWTGFAMYPWEQMGGFRPGGNPSVLKTAQEWQLQTPWYGKVEPADDHRMPWHRSRLFMGYLGQGGKFGVQGPGLAGDFAAYATDKTAPGTLFPGLLDISATADGRLLIQAAKGIHVAKRAAIISPTRIHRPEQPGGLGDDPTNYRPSGQGTAGTPHTITGNIGIPAAQRNLSRAAGLLDQHAYFFNYAAVHPFFHHAKDYSLPEESALPYTDGESISVPPFSTLASAMHLDAEAYKKSIPIDHRYGNSDVYTLGCGYDLLDDGGVVMYGGCGEEIRFAGGSITIACPGDIWLKSGRSTINWAGRDSIVRAKHSADVTVTEGDIRHKAERNYQVIAGNSGAGGILFDSRATTDTYDFNALGEQVVSSGIMFKAKSTQIVSWSAGVYLRTGGGDVGAGNIYLDADKGDRDIITNSSSFFNYLKNSHTHYFVNGDEVGVSNAFAPDSVVLCAETRISGRLVVAGDVMLRGDVIIAQGTVIAEGAAASSAMLPLREPALSDAYATVADGEQAANHTFPEDGDDRWREIVAAIYATGQPGNDDTITRAEASLRQLSDYRTQDFRVYEDRWQQLGRLAGTAGQTWAETPVVCQGTPTYPYPGREKFEAQTLYRQDLTLFDPKTGHAVDRGVQPNLADGYQAPTLADPTRVKLDEYLTT